MTHPTGKGMLIWDITACSFASHLPGPLAPLLPSSLSWVAIKVTDGILPFAPYQKSKTYPPILANTIKAFKDAGIVVWGWGYTYGVNDLHAQSEAFTAVEAVNRHTLAGFLIDAESQYKQPGAFSWASHYMDTLCEELPSVPIGLCSYRFPSLHREFPWDAFLPRCDFHAPQVYWEGAHTPGAQLERSIRELTGKRYLPIIPIGSAYSTGTWSMVRFIIE